MISSSILDVVIGLVFVYWLLSLICSTINEIIVALLGLRARELQNGIRILLQGDNVKDVSSPLSILKVIANQDSVRKLSKDAKHEIATVLTTYLGPSIQKTSTFVEDVFAHSLLRGLSKQATISTGRILAKGPSYIPARVFASAVYDTLFPVDAASPPLTAKARSVLANDKIPEGLRAMLTISTDQATSKLIGELQTLIADTSVSADVKKVLVELLEHSGKLLTDEARRLLNDLTIPASVRGILTSYLNQADASMQQFRENLEQWFNDGMDRVSGWYKRKTQIIVLFVAIIASVLFNIDTLAVANHLYRAPSDRAAIVALTDAVIKKGEIQNEEPEKRMDDLLKLTQGAAIADIGWPEGSDFFGLPNSEKVLKILGWALSTIAAIFGAPFWFDLLKKSLNMRNAGQKPELGQASTNKG